MRPWARWVVGLSVVMGLGLSGLVCQRVAVRGRFAVPYSSYGSGPEGSRALYLLGGELSTAGRWAQEITGLPEAGVLVALGGCQAAMPRPLSRYERENLIDWVHAGGVLLVAGAVDYLPEGLGVSLEQGADCGSETTFFSTLFGDEESADGPAQGVADPPDTVVHEVAKIVWAKPVDGPLLGLPPLALTDVARVELEEGAVASTILAGDDGPLGVLVTRGRGSVVVLASASPFLNGALRDSHGGVVFSRLLHRFGPGRAILFDEYHLGVGERRSLVQYLRNVGGAAILLQLLLVVALILWRTGSRLGAVQQEPASRPPGIESFVNAFGRLYSRCDDSSGAVAIVARDALGRVADHHRYPSANAEALGRHLDERSRQSEAEAVRDLGALLEARSAKPRELVSTVARIDELVLAATSKPEPTEGER